MSGVMYAWIRLWGAETNNFTVDLKITLFWPISVSVHYSKRDQSVCLCSLPCCFAWACWVQLCSSRPPPELGSVSPLWRCGCWTPASGPASLPPPPAWYTQPEGWVFIFLNNWSTSVCLYNVYEHSLKKIKTVISLKLNTISSLETFLGKKARPEPHLAVW